MTNFDADFEATNLNELILTAVRSSNFGVTIADARQSDFPLIYANSAFLEMTGYTSEDTVGHNCRFLQGPETDKKAVLRLRDAINNEQATTVLILNYRKDQSKFWNRLQLSPIHNKQGELLAYMSIQIDITQDVTYTTIERRRQKMETLGLLAGGVAHELNNALQPIILMAEVIKDGLGDDKELLEHCSDTILENANFAKDVVSGILNFARHEHADPEIINIQTLVKDISKFATDILPSTATLSYSMAPDLNDIIDTLSVEVNRTEFTQLFINLIANASDAMGGSGVVSLDLDIDDLDAIRAGGKNIDPGRFIKICVSDTGPGILEADLVKIFQPFYSTKQPGQGTGLGLSTAYAISQDWGGTIIAQSHKGAQFTVFIPVASPADLSAKI